VGPQPSHRPSTATRRPHIGPTLALAFSVGCATAPAVLREPEPVDPRTIARPSLDPLAPATLVPEWRSVRDRLAREDPVPAVPPSAVVHGAVLYAIERCDGALDDASHTRGGRAARGVRAGVRGAGRPRAPELPRVGLGHR
jgi:hypothetical protein